jgi:hypothetical protein
MNEIYKKIFEDLFDLETMIKSETSDDLQKGLLPIIRCVRSPSLFFRETMNVIIEIKI